MMNHSFFKLVLPQLLILFVISSFSAPGFPFFSDFRGGNVFFPLLSHTFCSRFDEPLAITTNACNPFAFVWLIHWISAQENATPSSLLYPARHLSAWLPRVCYSLATHLFVTWSRQQKVMHFRTIYSWGPTVSFKEKNLQMFLVGVWKKKLVSVPAILSYMYNRIFRFHSFFFCVSMYAYVEVAPVDLV